jgi:hypothetical protein
MAGKRAVKLRSVHDVSRLLAKTINQLLRGEILEGTAGKIGYLSNILLRALEQSDLEQRIKDLEDLVTTNNLEN